MSEPGVKEMRRVTVEFDLANYDDVRAAEKGELKKTTFVVFACAELLTVALLGSFFPRKSYSSLVCQQRAK